MTVQAKLVCTWNEPAQYSTEASPCHIVRFTAANGESEENKEWSRWTPFAHLEMNITNVLAFEQFVAGKEYLLTFEQVT